MNTAEEYLLTGFGIALFTAALYCCWWFRSKFDFIHNSLDELRVEQKRGAASHVTEAGPAAQDVEPTYKDSSDLVDALKDQKRLTALAEADRDELQQRLEQYEEDFPYTEHDLAVLVKEVKKGQERIDQFVSDRERKTFSDIRGLIGSVIELAHNGTVGNVYVAGVINKARDLRNTYGAAGSDGEEQSESSDDEYGAAGSDGEEQSESSDDEYDGDSDDGLAGYKKKPSVAIDAPVPVTQTDANEAVERDAIAVLASMDPLGCFSGTPQPVASSHAL